MDLGLKDKTALVLGAGGGLGGAIAKTLATEGAEIAVADINREAAEKTVSDIHTSSGSAMALEWDLANLDAIVPNLAAIKKQLGSVDVLVNITGGPPPTLVSGQSADSWRKYFDSMVLSVIAISDAVLPKMREKKWGRIITSTSSGVVAPIPNLGLSNSLRMSLLGWSKTLAGEVGRDGVTVNVVLPGRVATQRITFLDEQKAKREGKTVEDVSAASTASIPVGRYGDPQEYADVVAFMASSRASYLTGSVIRVDGGLITSV
ncbi:SDR family oxidoreductase [Rhizobium bangladeshense]|uniref:SDR family oxidoreductase n=1 Tax=Rhizobium bangladeshense TaxID=1138189 RepID=UPI001C8350C8|nr:SDR family oxidoreductase [Rhizobium bangladeshense]MBX4893286.1 SDR family oxidoreductase [Rhizobium bangladeshense]MBX4898779.1 SDR family oxidoreductase [Rhizobium bangladeshense]MBX4920713.1 SDR family oxidoreductase [Rhizobium bangladeshense]MBY3581655.1 SDR family oxidoreductase [Rhizobium bangladeshense]MBY3616924.1 SDR family oxidoreductase [Rhizobium bangladeshense]